MPPGPDPGRLDHRIGLGVVPDATLVLTVGLPMLKLASWALAALLLAGVTGLLRKT